MNVTVVDARRLTGLSRWAEGPAAAVIIAFDPELPAAQRETRRARWRAEVHADMVALGWPPPVCTFTVAGDAGNQEVWTASAPIDRLYAAIALCEAACDDAACDDVACDDAACDDAAGDDHASPEAARAAQATARQAIALEEDDAAGDARLLAAQAFAAEHDLPFLWCDDAVSIGWGARSVVWSRADVPADLSGLDPTSLGAIPVALITGTNGKTTTARLVSRIAQRAGHLVGATGTDGLVIDERVVEAGDWTGPGGARAVLRHADVDLAVLEAARGGMLRRGLGATEVDAAAVTNVSDDHLGEWGIDTVTAMAEVKLLVGRAVRSGGRLVLYDDGGALIASASRLAAETHAGSSNPNAAGPTSTGGAAGRLTQPGVAVLRYVAGPAASASAGPGRLAAWLELSGGDATLVIDDGGRAGDQPALRLAAADVPITIGGAARHNVANALCAALLARGLGLPDDAIRAGLRSFQPNAADSPGRSNLFTLRGARIILDFGHNPDGVRQVAEMAARLRADRRLVVTGQAGDRTDAEIRGLIDGLLVCNPDRWLLKSMPTYARGRPAGEVVAVLRGALQAACVPAAHITAHPEEAAAVGAALAELRPGDLLLLFVHADAGAALRQLLAAGATEGWAT